MLHPGCACCHIRLEVMTMLGLHVQMDVRDVEIATISTFKYMLDSSELLKGDASRHAFLNFVHIISISHPVDRWIPPALSLCWSRTIRSARSLLKEDPPA